MSGSIKTDSYNMSDNSKSYTVANLEHVKIQTNKTPMYIRTKI